MSLVYLAGAIDFAVDQEWRKIVLEKLQKKGLNVFDPMGAFNIGDMGDAKPVREINFKAIEESTVVFAEYNFNCMHTGTLIDIQHAINNDIPVVVWREECLPMYMSDMGVHHYNQLENAIDAVVKLAKNAEFGQKVRKSTERANEESSKQYFSKFVREVRDDRPCKNYAADGTEPMICGGTVKVNRLNHMARIPTKAYPNEDAGWDLYTSMTEVIHPGEFRDVHTGIAMEMPPGYYGRLVGRSSTLRERDLLVNEGIIDNGYRGEMFVGVWNLGEESVIVRPGERIAQLIFHKIEPLEMEDAEELSESERGDKGFGHSGK